MLMRVLFVMLGFCLKAIEHPTFASHQLTQEFLCFGRLWPAFIQRVEQTIQAGCTVSSAQDLNTSSSTLYCKGLSLEQVSALILELSCVKSMDLMQEMRCPSNVPAICGLLEIVNRNLFSEDFGCLALCCECFCPKALPFFKQLFSVCANFFFKQYKRCEIMSFAISNSEEDLGVYRRMMENMRDFYTKVKRVGRSLGLKNVPDTPDIKCVELRKEQYTSAEYIDELLVICETVGCEHGVAEEFISPLEALLDLPRTSCFVGGSSTCQTPESFQGLIDRFFRQVSPMLCDQSSMREAVEWVDWLLEDTPPEIREACSVSESAVRLMISDVSGHNFLTKRQKFYTVQNGSFTYSDKSEIFPLLSAFAEVDEKIRFIESCSAIKAYYATLSDLSEYPDLCYALDPLEQRRAPLTEEKFVEKDQDFRRLVCSESVLRGHIQSIHITASLLKVCGDITQLTKVKKALTGWLEILLQSTAVKRFCDQAMSNTALDADVEALQKGIMKEMAIRPYYGENALPQYAPDLYEALKRAFGLRVEKGNEVPYLVERFLRSYTK